MGHAVIVNSFARRQTAESRFSHYEGTWEELADLVAANLYRATPGYRDGVLCVPVPPEKFFSGVVTLTEECEMKASFTPRHPGEEPRKQVTAKGEKLPAGFVEVITYASGILGEDAEIDIMFGKNKKGSMAQSGGTEIISINASPTDKATPITPQALMANHFGVSGGTDTEMCAREFEEALREAFLFWKDKALVTP